MKLDIEFHCIKVPIELMQICGVTVAAVYAVLLQESKESKESVATLSNNEIGKRIGVPGRSIPAIILKLETLGIVERRYNPGYATSYYIKNIMLEPDQPSKRNSDAASKKKYGERGNVELTDNEYSKLIEKHGETMVNRAIARMDEYCQSHGTHYHDCYFTLTQWIKKGIYGKSNDIIRQQEMEEISKYLDLVNQFDDETS